MCTHQSGLFHITLPGLPLGFSRVIWAESVSNTMHMAKGKTLVSFKASVNQDREEKWRDKWDYAPIILAPSTLEADAGES